MRKFLVWVVSILLVPTIGFAMGRTGKRVKTTKIPLIQSVKLDPERTVVLRGAIDSVSGPSIVAQLTSLDAINDDNIFLIINSPGGSVYDGRSIITTIRSIKSPVICVIDSEAYSMAAVIAAHCNKLYIHKSASIMYHEASFSFSGTESIVKSRVDFLLKYLEDFHRETSETLNLSLNEFKTKMIKEWWMNTNQSVMAGVADVVIEKLVYNFDSSESRNYSPNTSKTIEPEWLRDIEIRM